MNCPRCNTPNEDSARFCKNCGNSLAPAPAPPSSAVQLSVLKRDIILLAIFIGWLGILKLVWLCINKLVVPTLAREYATSADISNFYRVTGVVTEAITLLLLIVFAVLVRNILAKIILILFALITFIAAGILYI